MNPAEVLHTQALARRLSDAEATIEALLSGQIDAVVDSTSQTPVLLSKAQAALRQSEERYRRIVETTNQGVWLLDARGQTTFMNQRMATMLGCEAADIAGATPGAFLDPQGMVIFADAVTCHRAGKSVQTMVRFTREDQTSFWGLVESSPLLDDAGRYEGSFAMIMDVTERQNAEEALRVSEARFRRLWDSGIILVIISDVTGQIYDVNEAGARMLGYSREEFLASGARREDITPAEWKPADDAAAAELLARAAATPWQKELIRKDGSRLPILAAAAMLEASQRITIAIDLTEQKRTEHALLERMRVLSMSSDVGIALTRDRTLQDTLQVCAEAVVHHLRAAFARIWTLNRRTRVLELQASAGMYTHLDGAHARIPLGKLAIGRIAEQAQAHQTNDLLNDPGLSDPDWARREGLQSFAGHPLSVNGEVVGVLAMFGHEPLSEVALSGLGSIADAIAVRVSGKQSEEARGILETQLRHAQKMEAVGRLAGGIAHDFNNLLSVILSYSEIMLGELKLGDPMRDDVEQVCKAGRRAAELTRQLLLFSRQQVMVPKVLDLNEVLTSMDKMLQRILGEDIDLVSLPKQKLGRVRLDPSNLEQVILNLVVNARDAMPTGGKLTIETGNVDLDEDYAREHTGVTAGSHVMLAVSDTGIGMNKLTQARMFEPFFTTKSMDKGTGLGLSTVYGIVQQSGGSISVYSEPGKGTSFKVYLPRVDAALDVARAEALANGGGSETILLVEDEDQVRAVASSILRRRGYHVLDARLAGEALLICERQTGPIHLLLTDVVMPQMSGPELAKRLSVLRPEMKVLCMSGYTDDSIVRHGVLQSEIAYLQKPITPQTLTRKVREVLDAPTRNP